MLKKLNPASRFECGLDAMLGPKAYAFFPVTNRTSFVGLAVGWKEREGYFEIPLLSCHSDSYPEMESYAGELNREAGLSSRDASAIAAKAWALGPIDPPRQLPAEGATCRECAMGSPIYIPCGRPATCIVTNRGETYPMCRACGDHNVKNRGARYVIEGEKVAIDDRV